MIVEYTVFCGENRNILGLLKSIKDKTGGINPEGIFGFKYRAIANEYDQLRDYGSLYLEYTSIGSEEGKDYSEKWTLWEFEVLDAILKATEEHWKDEAPKRIFSLELKKENGEWKVQAQVTVEKLTPAQRMLRATFI